MKKTKVFGLVVIGLVITFFNVLIGCVLIKALWPLIASRLFPELVTAGQVNMTLSYGDSILIGCILYVLIKAFSGNMIKKDSKGGININDISK